MSTPCVFFLFTMCIFPVHHVYTKRTPIYDTLLINTILKYTLFKNTLLKNTVHKKSLYIKGVAKKIEIEISFFS